MTDHLRELEEIEEILDETITEVPRRRLLLRVGIRVLVAGAVVWIVYFGILPRVADMQRVSEMVWSLSWSWTILLLALATVSLLARPPGVMAATPARLRYWDAMTVNQTGTAICNIVPGGGAFAVVVNHRQYRSWGLGTDDFSLMLLVSGLWNNYIKLSLPVAAVAILAVTGEVRAGVALVAGISLVLLVASLVAFTRALRSEDFTYRAGALVGRAVSVAYHLVRRPPVRRWGEAAVAARNQGLDLVRRRWGALTVTLLAPNLIDFFILLACLRGMGVSGGEVGWQDVLVAYSVSKLVTVIPITPGGIGLLELGLVGILVAAGGPEDQVVAATLLFRGLTFLPAFPVGAALGARWWWWNRSRREASS